MMPVWPGAGRIGPKDQFCAGIEQLRSSCEMSAAAEGCCAEKRPNRLPLALSLVKVKTFTVDPPYGQSGSSCSGEVAALVSSSCEAAARRGRSRRLLCRKAGNSCRRHEFPSPPFVVDPARCTSAESEGAIGARSDGARGHKFGPKYLYAEGQICTERASGRVKERRRRD